MIIGSIQSSLFSKETLSLLGEGAFRNFAGKASKVYAVYQTLSTIDSLGTVAEIDKISFDLMQAAGISTTDTSISALDTKFAKTSVFISQYSDYFTREFRYGYYNANTLYEIDMDLINSKDGRAREQKINQYVNAYKVYLQNNTLLFTDQIQANASSFELWLKDSSARRDNLVNEYKTVMGG